MSEIRSLLCSKAALKHGQSQRSAVADYWWMNSQLCRDRHPYVRLEIKGLPLRRTVRVISSKEGLPTLEYIVGEDKRRFFHSWYNPLKEAKQWAEKAPLEKDALLVVLGGGLLYHVSALLERMPESWPLVVVEKEEEIFLEAMRNVDLTPLLGRNNVTLHVGGDASDAIRAIEKVRRKHLFSPVLFVRHPPSVQTFPDYYRAINRAFSSGNVADRHDDLRYKKFCREQVSALLLTNQYFLMGDVISALKRLGVRYRLLTIAGEELKCEQFIESVAANIIEVRPDFILTLNHMGLDREGMLTDFLSRIEMPFVSWHVDNPHLIITQYQGNISPYCGLFVWDRDCVNEMRRLGFEHVFYAPLGVDEHRFRPLPRRGNPFCTSFDAIGFVGNSMVHKTARRLEKVDIPDALHCSFSVIAQSFADSQTRHVGEIIRHMDPEVCRHYEILSEQERAAFDTAVMWEATKRYRLERIRKLLPFSPVIAGDGGWHDLLDEGRFHYHGELSYYEELPYYYNAMKINFNATSRQMKEAVNQRVFDVPACNQFLLTDYQAQIEDLFAVGEEVICYKDVGEIEGLVKYYLRHDCERTQVAQRGYLRVIKDHTYVSRITTIINAMRGLFKS